MLMIDVAIIVASAAAPELLGRLMGVSRKVRRCVAGIDAIIVIITVVARRMSE